MSDLVERVAKAHYARLFPGEHQQKHPWATLSERTRTELIRSIEGIVTAILETHAIVPKEPTEEMVRLGFGQTDLVDASCTPPDEVGITEDQWKEANLREVASLWRIMLRAAPDVLS